MSREYRMCTRCIMDTTDPDIDFDHQGVCNHCHKYDRMVSEYVIEGEAGLAYLQKLAQKIKTDGKGKRYDCMIGVSGGVDSTYVAYKTRELGLRPLAVHLDNGWDSELAVKNIEQTLKILDIDLYTYVLDWGEFRDLQVSFLKASTPDSEIPTDHAIAAILGKMAEKVGVRYIILGTNVRTESHLPQAWSQGHHDWKYIRSVQAMFGNAKLKNFPFQPFFTYLRRSLFQKRVEILNYLDYDKEAAMKVLQDELRWQYYGGKHFESIYTRFYQGYLLPVKFGFDKRRVHLSSLICSGQISRDNALEEISKPTYPPTMQEEDREYVVKKLKLSDEEFQAILDSPPKSYWDYPSNGRLLRQPIISNLYQAGRNFYRTLMGAKAE
ncbi:MAG: N-acetyl sugar amidotransferase [Anaerolineales bacterium]|nr:N-acetyl sugar amidotransferase [Anaerolineales bacterium]